MPFTLELENYQGPFDVLLQLLDRQQLEITDLSLAKITTDYLDYVADLPLELEEMSSFLYVATKLTYNKSQAILDITTENDEVDLTESLQRYAQIKALAENLKTCSASPLYSRPEVKNSQATKLCSQERLLETYALALQVYQSQPKTKTIQSRSEQLTKKREQFMDYLRKLKSFSDQDVILNAQTRAEAALYLLTLLDLLRSGQLAISNQGLSMVGSR